MSSQSAIMAISIAGIAIAAVALMVSFYSLTQTSDASVSPYISQEREIVLFSDVDEDIDEDSTGIPPDLFSHEQIIIKKGDSVKIHFYNLEPVETQEHHTFTIDEAPYKMNYDINAGEDTVIEFTATKSGIYDYFCEFHQPTMTGQLVVLES